MTKNGMTVNDFVAFRKFGRSDPFDIDSWMNPDLSNLNIGRGTKVKRDWVNLV